ncbi:unnamed protein product, partial [Ceratitis capitata]
HIDSSSQQSAVNIKSYEHRYCMQHLAYICSYLAMTTTAHNESGSKADTKQVVQTPHNPPAAEHLAERQQNGQHVCFNAVEAYFEAPVYS